MSDEEIPLGRRKINKTPLIATHDAAIQKSAKTREVKARNKKVRDALEALERAEEEADAEEAAAAEAAEAAKAAKAAEAAKAAKGKAKAPPKESTKAKANTPPTNEPASSGSGSKSKASSKKTKVVSQEEENAAQVARDDARWRKLIQLLSIRDELPVESLNTLDLEELEARWTSGEGGQPASEKASVTKAPAKAKAPAKTPKKKKVISALPTESSIEFMNSPVDILKNAKAQSERLNSSSQGVTSRKRDPSPESGGAAKRPRGEPAGQSFKITGVSKPNKPAGKLAAPFRSASASTVAGGSAQGSVARLPSQDLPDLELGDPGADVENIDIDGGLDGFSDKEGSLETANLPKKKGLTDKKGRPKSGVYKGLERQILDQAILETVFLLFKTGLLPDAADYELTIEEGWERAVKRRRQDLEQWPMTKEHSTCIKQRINSWRGRVQTRIAQGIPGAYNLGPSTTNTREVIMDRAANLINKKFHRDPKAPGVGNYTAPFLAEAIHLVFFVGQIPVGTHFKKEFQSIPVPAIAYVAGVIETFLGYYQASGFFDKPKRQSVSEFMENVGKHHRNLRNMEKNTSAVLQDTQEALAADAIAFGGKVTRKRESKSARGIPGVLSDSDFETEDLTPEQLAERRRARRASFVPKKSQPTVDQPSDGESNGMEVDTPEVDAHSAAGADDSGLPHDSDESQSVAGSEVVQTALGKDGRPYVSFGDSDDNMGEVPASEKGVDTEAPGSTAEVDEEMADEKEVVEGGGDRGGKQDREDKDESEGDKNEEEDAGGNRDEPAGSEVGSRAQQVCDQEDSDLTDLTGDEDKAFDKPTNTRAASKTRSEVETATGKDGKDMDEQPPAVSIVPTQVAEQATPTGVAQAKAGEERMRKALEKLKARDAAKLKAAEEKAAAKKAAAGAAKASAKKKPAANKKGGAKETMAEGSGGTTAAGDKGDKQEGEAEGSGGGSRRPKRRVAQA